MADVRCGVQRVAHVVVWQRGEREHPVIGHGGALERVCHRSSACQSENITARRSEVLCREAEATEELVLARGHAHGRRALEARGRGGIEREAGDERVCESEHSIGDDERECCAEARSALS